MYTLFYLKKCVQMISC